MLRGPATGRTYDGRPESSKRGTEGFPARGNQYNESSKAKNGDWAINQELSDSEAEVDQNWDAVREMFGTGSNTGEVLDHDLISRQGSRQKPPADNMVSFHAPATTAVNASSPVDNVPLPAVNTDLYDLSQRPERPTTTTISDDRSDDSDFQRYSHLLHALAPQSFRQQQKLQQPHALHSTNQAYGEQLVLIEQQNNERLFRARNEQAAAMTDMRSKNLAHSVGPDSAGGPDETVLSIASALNVPAEAAMSLRTLQAYIVDLQGKPRSPKRYRHQIIHCGSDGRKYFDQPQWLANKTVAGNLPVLNLDVYIAKHPEVSFIVYRHYTSPPPGKHITDDDFEYAQKSNHSQEYIVTVTKELANAVSSFLVHCGFTTDPKEGSNTLRAPYVAVYHNRGHALESFLASLRQQQRDQFQSLLDYVKSQYNQEWAIVDDMIKRVKITSRFIAYLFKPGDVVVHGKLQNARGYLWRSWITPGLNKTYSRTSPAKQVYTMEVSQWNFDTVFTQRKSSLSLYINMNDVLETNIADLGVRPLRLMSPTMHQTLRCRGERFWTFRVRCLVSYHEDAGRNFHSSGDDRYMIDMAMYRELHKSYVTQTGVDDELEPALMEKDQPPDNDKCPGFLYLMPPSIKSFNLKSKKWVDLQVDRIGDVVWNDEAFKSLVIKEKTKQLIQALISNQIEAEKSTDLISGKGNGLIMLLHGGPGTGKTLTAESVAETARRPLYPVICGDIGTEPEHVEAYLESVLHIGKTWGCVVLLDEADVFLEERSFENLQRNALVSVFLRALEYYDGILILTSNRVGRFDEAFKSRIQLAIRYRPLDEHQRTKIWETFIRRLEIFQEDGIDFADLMDHVPDFAKKEMNGREIRNVITTGRQFVKWKRQQPKGENCLLNYKMMEEDILQPVAEFDVYLGELYGGNSSEQLAREEGRR